MASREEIEHEATIERLRKSRNFGVCQELSDQYKASYLLGATPCDRAKKYDGGFFEKFTTLDWKGEGNERVIEEVESLPEPKDLDSIKEGEGCKNEVVKSSESAETSITTQQREALFCEVLYTVMHRLGAQETTGHLTPGYLYGYAQEALKISEERHHELYTLAKERLPPTCFMHVTVVQARNLEAKDANGLSDPYCMLGLMRSELEETDANKNKRGKLRKRSTLRELLKDESIKVTTVRENTLNPTWEESFTLEVTDARNEKLHVDVWDCDDKDMLTDNDNKLTKIKGFQGVGRYFKDVVQSARATDNENIDDFLGYLEIPVKSVPVDGIDQWFILQSKSSKCRVSGECRVKVSLSSGKRPDLPSSVRAIYPNFSDIYGAVLHEFIAYDLNRAKEESEGQSRWSGRLSAEAEYILHQIAVQNDLTPLQEAAMRWRFYSERHWSDPMQYDMLCLLAQNVTKLWLPKKLAPKEDRALLKSLRLFVDNCLELLVKHRELYPPSDSGRFGRLVSMVECLNAVCDMDAYQEDDQEPLRHTLVNVLKESVISWYKKTMAWKEPQSNSSEIGRLSSLVDLVECVVADLIMALKFYRKVFFLVGVDYFTITYNQLEILLAHDVQQEMQNLNKKMKQPGHADLVGEKLFALYLGVKDIRKYRENITSDKDAVSALEDFYQWFKTSVTRWFEIAEDRANERIKKAVELDEFLRVDASVMHSTSAVDCAGCFHQIREFWRMLDWPDPVGCYVFVTQITNIICGGASYYADLLFENMKSHNYYDNDPSQFDVSEQLCVALNDIQHIRLYLAKLPETLGYERVISAMTKAHGEKGGNHTRVAMETMLSSADEDMQNKINLITNHIGQMMAVDVKRFVNHLAWSPNPKPAEEAIGPLLKYLDDDLMVLNKSVMKFVFEQILDNIWEIVIESFNHMMKTSRGNPPEFYNRLEQVMEIVKSFFHADGVGLSYDRLMSGSSYKAFMETLGVRKVSTEELILLYLAEKCERQKKAEEKYGAVTIRAIYDSAHRKLLVEVLNARDLPPLDTNGLSDPYVSLRLMPFHVFGREERKTKVIKNTLFPLFDDTFEFSVTPEQCKTKGACLSITVLDYDVITNDDIEGHAFLALQSISGLDEHIPGGFASQPQITLNLHHPPPKGMIFDILECRNDKVAQNFVKEERTIYEKTLSAHS
ncbi:BAI1-associated protein 3 isoform X2 [Nematostella vectensis]|uniref:BAI1-associated protein 3 isoform X2 n=1 Tax=Nematostella vectensis TaxID=45351 RepID=UPI0020773050|nr:BAI1-associated protein 3 isoform X2 [Nematostella vectensis]